MRYSKKLLAVVAGLGISACATPDMTDFAKQTATLQTAIAAEHQEIASQYDESIRLADQGKAESWFPTDRIAMAYDPAKLRDERKQVAEYAMQVDQLMASVSAYTTSLVNLAAQGETGKDAVDQAFGSVTSITALAGPAVQIPAGFVALGRAVGDAFTRAQAQDSLDSAMSIITQSMASRNLAAVVKGYFAEESKLVVGLEGTRIDLEFYKIGPNLIRFYLSQKQWAETAYYPDLLKCYSGGLGCRTATLENSRLEDAQPLLGLVTPTALAYFESEKRIQAWSKQRLDKVSAIDAALDDWAAEHDRFAAYFRDCGGFRALRASCGNYSAANLAAAVQTIKDILSDFETEPEAAGSRTAASNP